MSNSSKTHPLEFEKPIHELQKKLEELRKQSKATNIDLDEEVKRVEEKLEVLRQDVYGHLTAWQRVQIARHPARPFMLDYIADAFTDYLELQGDRVFGDDKAMPGGFATIGGIRVVVIGHQKGRELKENLKRNFGSAHPEGYRKALRLMRMAEKFGLPIVSFIDTPGAYPGVGAEERHISEAIAVNLREMMNLRVPVVAIVIGEGGSGGALGIGIADRVLMMENAYYSVISPEGCAAILWKHRSHAPEAAEALKLTAKDMLRLGIVDAVVPEPVGGAHQDVATAVQAVKKSIIEQLQSLQAIPVEQLMELRYQRYRRFGEVQLPG